VDSNPGNNPEKKNQIKNKQLSSVNLGALVARDGRCGTAVRKISDHLQKASTKSKGPPALPAVLRTLPTRSQ
jgi:hypothetical protein